MATMGIIAIILICALIALTGPIEGYDPSRKEIIRMADKSRQKASEWPLKRNLKYAKYWMVEK